ncbi:MAG: response regulator transcription factor [Eubacterium sp.]|nr:response regulator transcription factor [Eubacterium sp.]
MDRKKVMLIDDDKNVLELMKEQLESLYDVCCESSGEAALETLRAKAFDPHLILLDISMHGMDGYEVLGKLKENADWKKIPVVFLTGITDEYAECRGLEMDVVDYLKKPVAGKVLLARVQHYLDLYAVNIDRGMLDESKMAGLNRPLTDREMDVARLMAEFRSDREICDILYISMPYVKKLVASVKEKMGLEKRGDIRRYLK